MKEETVPQETWQYLCPRGRWSRVTTFYGNSAGFLQFKSTTPQFALQDLSGQFLATSDADSLNRDEAKKNLKLPPYNSAQSKSEYEFLGNVTLIEGIIQETGWKQIYVLSGSGRPVSSSDSSCR